MFFVSRTCFIEFLSLRDVAWVNKVDVLYCIDKKVIATVNKDLLSPILERKIYVGVVSYRVSQTVGDGKSPACY